MRLPTYPRNFALVLLFAVVLALRLPFLGIGYGWHADNWRIALAARHIAQTGVYEASRLPGYPVQEYIDALFWKTGAYGLNLLDALFSCAAAVLFALICIEYGVQDWWLAGLAMASVPVLFVNSVSSKDFPWALAFLLGAWLFARKEWTRAPVVAGVLLGLAMGSRITSGAAALPIALILADCYDKKEAARRVLTTGAIAAAIVLVAFLPVYWRYGWGFLDFYADHGFPTAMETAVRMTVGVWDWLGCAGLAFAGIAAIAGAICWKSKETAARYFTTRDRVAWGCLLAIYAVAFLCLPDEAAYLIPVIPFTLLLVASGAPRWAFQVCCVLIIASPWVSFNGTNPLKPVAGQILQDRTQRLQTDAAIAGFLKFAAGIPGLNVYIVGSWGPPIDVLTADKPHPEVQYIYLAPQAQMDQLVAKGWHVWYLPNMREFEARVYHYDITEHGARDVRGLQAAGGAAQR